MACVQEKQQRVAILVFPIFVGLQPLEICPSSEQMAKYRKIYNIYTVPRLCVNSSESLEL